MESVKQNIQLYADKVHLVEIDGKTLNLHINGVDIAQITSQFRSTDVLDSLDFDVIADYVDNERNENALDCD